MEISEFNHYFTFDKDFESNNDENNFIIEESILFVVDGNKQMFKNNYFQECLETYKNIVRKKCSRNKKENIGLIVYGTNDTNCDINSVMVLQKFDSITIDSLKNIKHILKNDIDKYEQMSSNLKYSLFDVLSYALQVLYAYKRKINTRCIMLLCTSNDDPCCNDVTEKNRIEHLATSFKDNQIELRVVGFSDTWNDKIFYKDLQITSGISTCDYKKIHLKDFEDNVLNPARSICKLPWKLNSGTCMQVTVFNLVSTPTYPSKIKLESENNQFLEIRRVLFQKNQHDSQLQNFEEFNRNEELKVVDNKNIIYYKTFGGIDISFKLNEYKAFKNLGLDPGIQILGFKPISCDPLYHIKPAYFVTYNNHCSDEGKIIFMCLVSKCTSEKVMPICRVVTSYAIFICRMIPSEEYGGFYLYKIPFDGQVRNIREKFPDIISIKDKCIINEEAVDVFKDLMELSKIQYDPRFFTNPKLEKCVAHIEALALDEKLDSLPSDKTLPPPSSCEAKVLEQRINEFFDLGERDELYRTDQYSSKRIKLSISDMAKNKSLHQLSVAELKHFLTAIHKSTQGKKSILMDRIYKHFNIEDNS